MSLSPEQAARHAQMIDDQAFRAGISMEETMITEAVIRVLESKGYTIIPPATIES